MLNIQHIRKVYQKNVALDDISLKLDHGIYALLGPNGAGKSTLMRILCNQCVPDQGEVTYQDINIMKADHYYQDLGYAPQQQGLYDDFTGMRFLTYLALLKGIEKTRIEEAVQQVAKLVNMQDHLLQRCVTYSGGMKQRKLVASALLGNPKVLLFDEPTAGLDPKERVSLRNVFAALKQDHILLIATHVVSDVESIADQVIFLRKGTIIEQGSPSALSEKYPQYKGLEELYLNLFDEVT